MRVIGAEVAGTAGGRVSRLFQRKPMRGMAAVTFFLDAVTALTEGGADFLGDAQVFPLNSHPFKSDGMSALLKIFQLFLVTFSAFIRENHRLLFSGGLMVNVAGHTMDAIFCVFRFNPRLEKPGCHFLMTIHAESWVHLRNFRFRRKKRTSDER
jgi:hypothetical protein